jgi:hypothetical protein
MEKLKIIYIHVEVFVRNFEQNPFVRLFVGGIFIVTAWALIIDLQDRKSEAIARAWQILTTRASGNSGKVEALQYLISQRISLNGIDLSCKMMGGINGAGKCIRYTWLSGLETAGIETVDASNINFSGVDLSNANLRRFEIFKGNFSGAKFIYTKFKSTMFTDSNLANANLIETTFVLSGFSRSNLEGATLLGADVTNTPFYETNISFAKFAIRERSEEVFFVNFGDNRIKNLTQEQINDAWAWADRPPIGLEFLNPPLKIKYLCDPKLRDNYESKQQFGLPKGC